MAEYEVDLNDLGTPGVIADLPGYMLPPEAWTYGHNIRVVDGNPQRIGGQTQVFGTPTVTPHYVLPIASQTQVWWLYTSLTKAYVYDGAAHTDITRTVGGNYTAAYSRDWNGTVLGGVPILNNGADVPQYWSAYSAATALAALSNWPATYRAKVIRAFGPQLVALNITKGASIYPHNVLWSHSADPGSVPSSWDTTDTTKDTGETALPDVESGVILDGMMLRGSMYIGKENAIWRMSRIGGRFIFDFKTYLETVGLIAPRCMTNIGSLGQQSLWGQNDILIHNGSTQQSILDRKWRRTLFGRIDTTSYLNCFSFDNVPMQEMWYCFPDSGQTNPSTALIWNYKDGSLTTTDINFRNVGLGIVPSADVTDWDTPTTTWEDYSGVWDSVSRQKLVACITDSTQFRTLDIGLTRNGSSYTAALQREGLSIIGRKRDGEWIVDHKVYKMFTRIWIKASGGPFNVRIGMQDTVGGSVTWSTTQSFNPATQNYIDVTGSGRAIAMEISTTDSVDWRIYGYKVEYSKLGNF